MKVYRSYKLMLYGNTSKIDTARYTQKRFNDYCNMFLGRFYFGEKKISTVGMGKVASIAARKSSLMIKTLKASQKATGSKTNVPFAQNLGCRARIEKSNSSSFDYWVKVSNQFSKKPVSLPTKSHKALNKALRDGWKFTKTCEFKMMDGKPYAMVFVERTVAVKKTVRGVIGIDVGYKYSATDSTGYVGRKVSQIIRRSKLIQAERRRQKHKISSKVKTSMKQVLDIEAKRVIGRSGNVAFAVENPKRLANLSSGRLHGWARSYFANRLGVLCKENGIPLIEVSPYQTSITCSKCKAIDKQSRVSRDRFECPCGYKDHADINAAKNIALKGTQKIRMGKIPVEKFKESKLHQA